MAKRHTRNKRHKTRNMKGGALSQDAIQQLRQQGFSTHQIDSLQDLGVSLNEIMQKVNMIMNEGSQIDPDYMTEQVMVELLNEHIFNGSANQLSAIPHAEDDIHDIDIMNDSFNSQGTMNLNELSRNSDSGYTTSEDRSLFDEFGGKKRRRISRKNSIPKGKRRTTRRNSKRNLTLKGGMCFGKGVGANSYDPNYSIYNTNMLNLFPYKP
jgi:hypothetical protein